MILSAGRLFPLRAGSRRVGKAPLQRRGFRAARAGGLRSHPPFSHGTPACVGFRPRMSRTPSAPGPVSSLPAPSRPHPGPYSANSFSYLRFYFRCPSSKGCPGSRAVTCKGECLCHLFSVAADSSRCPSFPGDRPRHHCPAPLSAAPDAGRCGQILHGEPKLWSSRVRQAAPRAEVAPSGPLVGDGDMGLPPSTWEKIKRNHFQPVAGVSGAAGQVAVPGVTPRSPALT